MKYYIPTSSLNLDVILQAESISPRSFYAQRKTGYKSIELIDEVKLFDSIVLITYPVSFFIEDPGRYNYPLLIEVEDDSQLQDIHNIEGTDVHLCSHTIYLTPQNSAFYFFTNNAYELTTINTKSNKSIKYYEKYNIFPCTSQLKLNPIKIKNVTDTIAVFRSNETTVDKQKGVLYAFLIGQLLSVTTELAHQQRLSQELYNILTGIISNPKVKDNFLNKLEPLLKEYKSIDPIELKNKEKFEAKFNDDLGKFKRFKSYFKTLLEKWGVWESVSQYLSHEWDCEFLPNITDISSYQDFVELRNKIEIHSNDATVEYRKKQPIPSIESISTSEDIILIGNMPIINRTVDYIIKNQLTADYLSANRQSICKKLIKDIVIEEIKKIKGDGYWENSLEQKYFNDLYTHIGDLGKPFNLKLIDDPELVAVASFLLQGHDLNRLLAYLKSNEICDYRFVLVLWGALWGYMEMNKEFLSEILTLENYRNVYKCLFHKPMGELKQNSNEKELKKDNNKISDTKIVDEIDNNEILSFIDNLIEVCPGAKNKRKTYTKLFSQHGLTEEFIWAIKEDKTLYNNKGVIPKNILGWIVKEIAQKSKKQKKLSNQKSDSSLKENTQFDSGLFVGIQNPENIIDKLLCFKNTKKDVMKRLRDNWDYVLSQKNNKTDIINYFINLCKKESEGRAKKRTALFGFFTDEMAIKCKKELEEKYDR